MAKCQWITLDTSRRGEDEDLFKFYHGLYGQDVKQVLPSARANYPVTMPTEEHDVILCVSHEKRLRINKYINERAGGLFVPCEEEIKGTTCQPQSMFLKVGLELIGCPRGVNGKRGIVQGVVYTVCEVGPEVKIRMNDEYQLADWNEAEVETTLPLEEVPRLLRLTHAMCYYTVQGRTMRDKHILLTDTDHPFFTTRSLIVGMSRATHGKYVHVQ